MGSFKTIRLLKKLRDVKHLQRHHFSKADNLAEIMPRSIWSEIFRGQWVQPRAHSVPSWPSLLPGRLQPPSALPACFPLSPRGTASLTLRRRVVLGAPRASRSEEGRLPRSLPPSIPPSLSPRGTASLTHSLTHSLTLTRGERC